MNQHDGHAPDTGPRTVDASLSSSPRCGTEHGWTSSEPSDYRDLGTPIYDELIAQFRSRQAGVTESSSLSQSDKRALR